ncbi:MAG: formylglycine-generating enzyme family protein [Planctomycetaceae bacterium]|nr:formylglycine-generating enzyme family protein [Planctomycetaceae bacterium]
MRRLLVIGVFSLEVLLSASLSVAADPLIIDLGGGVSIELLRIPAGEFLQGSAESENGRDADETPHEVTLTKGFFLGKTPVTVGQFHRFVSETNYRTESETGTSGGFGVVNGQLEQRPQFNWRNPGYVQSDEHPVTIITFGDANEFLKWLSKKAQREMLLPTESQWEYACRAGTTSMYYNGDDDAAIDAIGWHQKNSGVSAMPVGQKQPNAFGLLDMSGNVYQWCRDVYNNYPTETLIDPLQELPPQGDKLRNVLRGGSWMRPTKRCRSAARYRATPGTRNAENGFRVATFDGVPLSVLPIDGAVKFQAESDNPAASTATADGQNTATPTGEAPYPIGYADGNGNQNSVSFQNSETEQSFASVIFWFLFWVIVGGFGIFLFILTMIFLSGTSESSRSSGIRKTTRNGWTRTATGTKSRSPSVRIEQDGFWVSTGDYPIGTVLFCQYWSADQKHEVTLIVEHSEQQFVYTGVKPQKLEVHVFDASGDSAAQQQNPLDVPSDIGPMATAQGLFNFLQSDDTGTPNARADQGNQSPPVNHGLRAEADDSFPPAY